MSNLNNIKLTPKQNLIAVLFILLILASLGFRLDFSTRAQQVAGPGFIVSTDKTATIVYNTDIYQLDGDGNILNQVPLKELGLKHKIIDIQILDDNRFVIGDWINEAILLCEFRRRSCEPLTEKFGSHIRDFFMFYYHEAGNELFISDTTNHRILHYDINTHKFKTISKKKEFLYPNHLQVEQDGYLYIADANHNRIAKFTYDGEQLIQQGDDFTIPDSLAEKNLKAQWICNQDGISNDFCKTARKLFPDYKQDWLLHFARQEDGGLYVLAANGLLINSDLIYFPASPSVQVKKIKLPEGSGVTTFSFMADKLLLNDKELFKLYAYDQRSGDFAEFGSEELKAIFKKDYEQNNYWEFLSTSMLILLFIIVICMVLFIFYLAKKGNKHPGTTDVNQTDDDMLPLIVPGKVTWLAPNPMLRWMIPTMIIVTVIMFALFYGVFDLFGISIDKVEEDSPALVFVQASALLALLFLIIFVNIINNIYYKIGTDGIYIYVNKIFGKYKIPPHEILYSDTHLFFNSASIIYRNKMKHYFSDKEQFEKYIMPLLNKFSKEVDAMAAFFHAFKHPGLLDIFNVLSGMVLVFYMVKLGIVFA